MSRKSGKRRLLREKGEKSASPAFRLRGLIGGKREEEHTFYPKKSRLDVSPQGKRESMRDGRVSPDGGDPAGSK